MIGAEEQAFEAAYTAWRKRIEADPRLSLSSRTYDYTDLKEYQAMIDLGKDALPAVMRKIESGDWLLNEAALQMAGLRSQDIVPDADQAFLSEQEFARRLLEWWRQRAPKP